jgi:Pyruvate/2-oxoacid:ferredoxin oxidoreductase gamma subunit
MILNILICGIGGQGVVYLGSFLRHYFLWKFQDSIVLGTESRGVSQREGSVTATIRVQKNGSKSIFSPEIPPMSADVIIAFEPIELLRNISYIGPNTMIFANNEPILPKNSVERLFKSIEAKNSSTKQAFSKPQWVISQVNLYLDGIIEKKSPKKISPSSSSYSAYENLHDRDFMSLSLDELEDSGVLNMVILGFLSKFSSHFMDYESIVEFMKTTGKEKKKRMEKNLQALRFGFNLASS